MIINDSKKLAQVVLKRFKNGEPAGEMIVKPEVSPDKEVLHMLMEDFMMAIKDGSVLKATDAFIALCRECDNDEDEEESDDSGD